MYCIALGLFDYEEELAEQMGLAKCLNFECFNINHDGSHNLYLSVFIGEEEKTFSELVFSNQKEE